ncbi:MAG: hypothetical protein GY865_03305, partial [candidate division Zixibacteria bacterium]|nr:hypothetical protein [candidate division Zixibacteria bacterium]
GCDWNRGFGLEPPMSLRGNYSGHFKATYPGPDCGAVIVEDSIHIRFTDRTFVYYWLDSIDSLAAGQGNYSIESTLMFENNIAPTINPYLTINGAFGLRYVRAETAPDTLILTQGVTPEDPNGFFENIYMITLIRSDEIRRIN